MIGLYMDENVEGQIVRGLRARNRDVLTAEEDGHGQTPDPQVLDRATTISCARPPAASGPGKASRA